MYSKPVGMILTGFSMADNVWDILSRFWFRGHSVENGIYYDQLLWLFWRVFLVEVAVPISKKRAPKAIPQKRKKGSKKKWLRAKED